MQVKGKHTQNRTKIQSDQLLKTRGQAGVKPGDPTGQNKVRKPRATSPFKTKLLKTRHLRGRLQIAFTLISTTEALRFCAGTSWTSQHL